MEIKFPLKKLCNDFDKYILKDSKMSYGKPFFLAPGLSDDEVRSVGRVAAAPRSGGGRGVQRLLLLMLLRLLLLLLLLLLQVVLWDHAEGVCRRRRVRGSHGGGVVVVLERKTRTDFVQGPAAMTKSPKKENNKKIMYKHYNKVYIIF